MENALIQKLFDAVEDNFPEQLRLTRDLVEIPSQMRTENRAQDLMELEMRGRGFEVDRFELDVDVLKPHRGFSPVEGSYEGVTNVVGTYRPREKTGRSLILNGHIDVVPVGPLSQWSRDPYEPHVEGDWLYGRGSGDMKGGLAATLFAYDAVRSLGLQPQGDIIFQSVVEEECTGNGTLACLVRGYEADAVIIPEPVQEALIRCSTGISWFRVKIMGRPSHPSDPASGINAIEVATHLIDELKSIEKRWNDRKGDHGPFADVAKPIYLNAGRIEGGDWASSVPAWCTVDFRINHYPGIDPKEIMSEVEAVVAAYAAGHSGLRDTPPVVEYPGHLSEGYFQPAGTDAEAALANAHQTVHGQHLRDQPFTGYLDATVYAIYGDCPSLVYGPRSENIHSFDERVSLSSLKNLTKTLALFICDWCGVKPSD